MFDSIKGKVAIVTGGSRGIGKSIVELLNSYGVNVALLYNSNECNLDMFNLINKEVMIKQYQVDVSKVDSVKHVFKTVESDFKNIDFLVNVAGIISDSYLMLMSEESFDNVIDINLKGNFLCMKEVIPYMLGNNNGGAIVNISSIAGLTGVIGQSNYCASKAGIIAMTKVLAKELAHKNIRVNAVAPGYIETDMIKNLNKKIKDIQSNVPMKRVGLPEEVSNVVLFLLSEGASYITGETVVVDGGLLI